MNEMKTLSALCAMLVVVAAGCVHRPVAGQPSSWRSDQEVWWTTPGLVKNAIVAHLRFLDEHPEAEQMSPPYWETMSLILLLDQRQDRATIEVLADLTSYYIGESGNELLHCVILRLGPNLAPLLEERLSSGRNDCQTTLGSSKRCLIGSDYRTFLETALGSIRRDESCYIEE
jgi:hypothetical protein